MSYETIHMSEFATKDEAFIIPCNILLVVLTGLCNLPHHQLLLLALCVDHKNKWALTHETLRNELFIKPTDSLFQNSALLSQFNGMNIAEGSLVAQHFTVDRSHHELLHLPLNQIMTKGRSKHIGNFVSRWNFNVYDFLCKTAEKNQERFTMVVLGEDTCSLIAKSSC